MSSFLIPPEMLRDIIRQAEQEYPKECCGMILGPAQTPGAVSRLIPCKNIQDSCHGSAPFAFPRTAREAYFMDPETLFRIHKQCRENQEDIRVIYHSHIDAGSYFSSEDKKMAVMEGSPAYPGALYMVVSVQKGRAVDYSIYGWDDSQSDYIQTYHEILPNSP